MLKPTNRAAVEALLEDTEVELEWMAQEIEIDKIRFRDGSRVLDELQKIGQANCHYMYETRDGKLRVTDDTSRQIGDSLILGQNILSFSAEQSEDQSRSEIRVKGQRTPKEVWGKKAVEEIEKVIQDGSSTNKAVVTVQHYGDATGEALERRANFEASNRNSASKQITIEVFSVVGQTAPYDVGLLHYVEVPTEGIFDVFECTALSYSVEATDTLRTTLTLSPPPSSGVSGGATGGSIGVPSASTNIPIPSPAPRS